MRKDISLTNKQKLTYKVSKEDLYNFLSLTKNGLDVETVIKLSFDCSDEIINDLNQGKKLTDIFSEHSNDAFFNLLQILSNYMSLENALSCAVDVEQTTKKRKMKILSKIAYPLFLFIFSYVLVLFFSVSIVPSMSVYATDSSLVIVDFLNVFYSILFICLFVLLFLFVLRHRIQLLERFFLNLKLVKETQSVLFSYVWKNLLSNGLSTTECIDVLEKVDSTKLLARKLNQYLKRGFSLMDSIRNAFEGLDVFCLFIETGLASSNLVHLLEIYVDRTQQNMERKLKRITNMVQLFSYLCVALVVFVFYQVMLMPLNMLNTF